MATASGVFHKVMIQSAALKLTMFYLMVIMALSIGFSVAIYRISSRDVAHTFPTDRTMANIFGPTDFNFDELRQQQDQQSENDLRNNLLILNAATLLVGAAVSYGLALQTLQPLEESMKAQGRFIADASHELRTPLTAMRTTIEVGLRDPKLTLPKAKILLGSTLDEVKKLSALSNGLLQLARDNGKDIPKEPVSLKAITKGALSPLELAAHNKSITLKNEVGDLSVLGDATSLQQIVGIFVDNAIKYGNEKMTVTLKSRTSGKYAFLSVSDEGPGIKASDLPYIFDRFYRADTSRTRGETEGYGLGLSIAQAIAQAHGGSVDVKSALGRGSTFTVKLPLAPGLSASP